MPAAKTTLNFAPSANAQALPDCSRTAAASPNSRVDTSNLSPGAAARFEKLMRSIDDFTAAVQSKAIILTDGK